MKKRQVLEGADQPDQDASHDGAHRRDRQCHGGEQQRPPAGADISSLSSGAGCWLAAGKARGSVCICWEFILYRIAIMLNKGWPRNRRPC